MCAGLLLHKLIAPLQGRVRVFLLVGRGEGEESQRFHGEGQVRGVSQRVARVQVDPYDGRAVVLTPQDVTWATKSIAALKSLTRTSKRLHLKGGRMLSEAQTTHLHLPVSLSTVTTRPSPLDTRWAISGRTGTTGQFGIKHLRVLSADFTRSRRFQINSLVVLNRNMNLESTHIPHSTEV